MKKLSAVLLVLTLTLTLAFVLASCGEEKSAESQADKALGSQAETVSGSAQSDVIEMTVTLQNISDRDFKTISVSEAGKESWTDSLITETLKSGSKISVKIKMPADAQERQFDLLATLTDGEKITFSNVDLSELTEKGGTVNLYITEGGDANADFQQPYTEPTLTIDSTPTKLNYKVGEKFDPTGFSATYTDEEGVATTISADDVQFVVSKTVVITADRAFTAAGTKTVVVEYYGLEQEFELTVE